MLLSSRFLGRLLLLNVGAHFANSLPLESLCTSCSEAQATPVAPPTPAQILNATAFAITYGYPILPYLQLVEPLFSSVGTNAIYNEPALASSQEAAIVRPNVDTLYSRVAVDLSHTDLELTVPPVKDGRFYVIPFYDLYGNNFANIGSVNNSAPGKYLVRRASNTFQPQNDDLLSEGYQGVVDFPTTYGSILIRILLCNNTTDVAVVQAIQKHISIDPVKRSNDLRPDGPALSPTLLSSSLNTTTAALVFPGSLDTTTIVQLLNLTARLAPYDPPENTSETDSVNSQFAIAGLCNGIYIPPAGVNLTLAGLLVARSIQTALQSPSLYESFGNSWRTLIPAASGNFHSYYAARAYIAWSGYLQLVPYEALYPAYFGSGSGDATLTVAANQSYLFTFSGKPPVTGFWSLTAYGSNNYLIPNAQDIYSLGDRSNLTYPDGTLVYGNASSNGEFQILMQPANLSPPANWTKNWLPAPSGGGVFSVNLRWYGPTSAFTDGSYAEPIVTLQAALVG
ncbi:hypothetical protein MMC11_001151 [Xylographa trunciseda]|nr:hypothetical protein [Xylographa trunciseda]